MKHINTLFIASFLFANMMTLPVYAKSFYMAKKEATQVYTNHQEAFYSGCEYYAQKKKLIPLKDTCGYQTRKSERRASRIEWEHVVSMWHVGHQLQCWQNGGRNNCRKVSEKFRQMEADLHNLVPSIGELNGDRSNYQHGMIEGEVRRYGPRIDNEVDFKAKVFEPRPEVRGDIARIYFYYREKYGFNLSRKQTQLFKAWSKSDPVDSWERERNLSIQAIQGDSNFFVGDSSNYINGLACTPTVKYCYQMNSCEQANFYLNQCGRSSMDRDKDGVPCESICR